jgi:hypothetical protein
VGPDQKEIGAACLPASFTSCHRAIMTTFAAVMLKNDQLASSPVCAQRSVYARLNELQDARNHPFDIPVSVLLQSDAAHPPNTCIRNNAAYRDECTKLFGRKPKTSGCR